MFNIRWGAPYKNYNWASTNVEEHLIKITIGPQRMLRRVQQFSMWRTLRAGLSAPTPRFAFYGQNNQLRRLRRLFWPQTCGVSASIPCAKSHIENCWLYRRLCARKSILSYTGVNIPVYRDNPCQAVSDKFTPLYYKKSLVKTSKSYQLRIKCWMTCSMYSCPRASVHILYSIQYREKSYYQ